MPAWDHERRLKYLAATSAVVLNADIRLRCNICRNGQKQQSASQRYTTGSVTADGLALGDLLAAGSAFGTWRVQ